MPSRYYDLNIADEPHPRSLQFGGTPLFEAAEKNSSAVAELLIRSGADVNAKNQVSIDLISMYDTFYNRILYDSSGLMIVDYSYLCTIVSSNSTACGS